MSANTEPQSTPEIIRLSIEDDEGVRATYPIIHEQIRVGRSEDNEVCLNQRNISREHALLIAEPSSSRLVVHDLNSYTGIKLNGKRIFENCYLKLGDYLEIGGYVISLEMDGVESDQSGYRDQETLRSEVEPLPPEQHARLVVVSNNLAGREYYLNRVEMLIGREQGDNDLVINHRSISRNHAKIVWKNNEFTIIDLSSSNGVLIGGTPFSAARLMKGSIIQMGLVKFRYVAPGEDYTFNPVDLEVTTLDEPGHTRKIIGAILVFITIFFLSRQLITQITEPEVNQSQQVDEDKTKQPEPAVLIEASDSVEPVGESGQTEGVSKDDNDSADEQVKAVDQNIEPSVQKEAVKGTSILPNEEAARDQSDQEVEDKVEPIQSESLKQLNEGEGE